MENYSLDNLHFDLVVTEITEIAKKRGLFDAKNHLNIMIDRNSPSMPKRPELPSLRSLTTQNFKVQSNTIQRLQAHIDEIKKYQFDFETYNKEYKIYEKKITELNNFGSNVIFHVILRVTNFYEFVPQDEQTVIIDLLKSIRDARFISTDTLHEIVTKIVSDYKWRD